MEYSFEGVSWDSENLTSAKQGLKVLLIHGVAVEEILQMDNEGAFGNSYGDSQKSWFYLKIFFYICNIEGRTTTAPSRFLANF